MPPVLPRMVLLDALRKFGFEPISEAEKPKQLILCGRVNPMTPSVMKRWLDTMAMLLRNPVVHVDFSKHYFLKDEEKMVFEWRLIFTSNKEDLSDWYPVLAERLLPPVEEETEVTLHGFRGTKGSVSSVRGG